jgi:hypothetical protein
MKSMQATHHVLPRTNNSSNAKKLFSTVHYTVQNKRKISVKFMQKKERERKLKAEAALDS